MTFIYVHHAGTLRLLLATQVRTVAGNTEGTSFQVIQDDLLHPVLGGNKLRKLDALLPALEEAGVRHLVQHVPPYAQKHAFNFTGCAPVGMQVDAALRLHIVHKMPTNVGGAGEALEVVCLCPGDVRRGAERALRRCGGGVRGARHARAPARQGRAAQGMLAPVHALNNYPDRAIASPMQRGADVAAKAAIILGCPPSAEILGADPQDGIA